MNEPIERYETRTVVVHMDRAGVPFDDDMKCDWCRETDKPEALTLWMGGECIAIYCTDCEDKVLRMVGIAVEEARDAVTP